MVKILAIESSCDETAAAVITDNYQLLSSVISTQIAIHQPYGGVVPEIASRYHLDTIVPCVDEALKQADTTFEELDAIAVTKGPGLIGSLLVGVSYAKAVSLAHNIPLIGVHHLEGHINAAFLENSELSYPFVALVVSGSHSGIIYVEKFGSYKLLGQSRDDAAGEAFDKISRALGLGYPGGPAIQEAARRGEVVYNFPQANLGDTWDFSFSGVKSAVLNFLNNAKMKKEEYKVEDVAASFQFAIVDALATKAAKAACELKVKNVVLAGGVAANMALRESLISKLPEDIKLNAPSIINCTDNAAMIGAVALNKFANQEFEDYTLNASSHLPFCQ